MRWGRQALLQVLVVRWLVQPANVLDYCVGYSSTFIVSIISLKLFRPASMYSIISFEKIYFKTRSLQIFGKVRNRVEIFF